MMFDPAAAVDFAREVYAASATVGHDSVAVRRLKVLLDAAREPGAAEASALAELAQKVQAESIDWIARAGR